MELVAYAVSLALRGLGHDYLEFKTSSDYIVSSRLQREKTAQPGWRLEPINSALERQRQEDCHSLRLVVYMEFSRNTQQRPHIKQTNQ